MLGRVSGEELAPFVAQIRDVRVPHAEFVRRNVEERGLRVVDLGLPAGATEQRRANFDGWAAHRRPNARILHALARHRIGLAPGERLDEGRRGEEFPVFAIERVDVSELVGLDDRLQCLPVADDVDHVMLGDRVVVERLVRQVLVEPLHLPGVEVERDGRHRVETVALAHVGDPRRRVSGPEVEEVRRRIVRPRMPDRRAADLPRVGGPGLAAGLTGGGNRVPSPLALAGVGIEGLDESARSHLARSGHPDDDLAFHDERSLGHEVAVRVVHDLRLPDLLAGLRVERDEMRVQRAEDHAVLVERDPAVVGNQADERADVVGNLALVPPERHTGDGVHRVHAIERQRGRRREHHAVVHDRRRLLVAEGAAREDPLRHQLLDVARIDLVERAEAPAAVGAVVHEPLRGRRRRRGEREEEDGQCGDDDSRECTHTVLR